MVHKLLCETSFLLNFFLYNYRYRNIYRNQCIFLNRNIYVDIIEISVDNIIIMPILGGVKSLLMTCGYILLL